MNEDKLNEISIACTEDERLREILGRILSMNEKELKEFKTKLTIFYLDKKEIDDIQAFEFFKVLLDNRNAFQVGRKVGLV